MQKGNLRAVKNDRVLKWMIQRIVQKNRYA